MGGTGSPRLLTHCQSDVGRVESECGFYLNTFMMSIFPYVESHLFTFLYELIVHIVYPLSYFLFLCSMGFDQSHTTRGKEGIRNQHRRWRRMAMPSQVDLGNTPAPPERMLAGTAHGL